MANYLLTGACGGMGSALCRLLTESGDRVWGLDAAESLDACPWTVLQADLTSPADLEAALARIRREAGSLDGIIHMAGIYDLDALAEMDEARFLRDFNVNVFGAFRVNRLFLPLLRPGGRILIVTSELAPLDPLPFPAAQMIVSPVAPDRFYGRAYTGLLCYTPGSPYQAAAYVSPHPAVSMEEDDAGFSSWRPGAQLLLSEADFLRLDHLRSDVCAVADGNPYLLPEGSVTLHYVPDLIRVLKRSGL